MLAQNSMGSDNSTTSQKIPYIRSVNFYLRDKTLEDKQEKILDEIIHSRSMASSRIPDLEKQLESILVQELLAKENEGTPEAISAKIQWYDANSIIAIVVNKNNGKSLLKALGKDKNLITRDLESITRFFCNK